MSLSRLRTSLRYKGCLRIGLMTYIIVFLLLLALWTLHQRRVPNILEAASVQQLVGGNYKPPHNPESETQSVRLPHGNGSPILVEKKHPDEALKHILRKGGDDQTIFKGTRNKRKEVPVFGSNSYPANHSHPILVVPPELKSASNKTFPCSKIRQVEFFGENLLLTDPPLCGWLDSPEQQADGKFVVYSNVMALLYDVLVDPSLRAPGPKGGEDMQQVWGQKEDAEYLVLRSGFFQLQCKKEPMARFGMRDHLNQWQAAVKCTEDLSNVRAELTVPGLTIAVQRYEYVNFYHTMTDYYNAFLAMLAFNQHPDNVTILWVDAHPKGGLDGVWDSLFGKVYRAAHLPGPTKFSALVWAAQGYNSPMNEHGLPNIGYLSEFRHFFLSRHNVDGGRTLNCSSLNIFFIWRRDYVAHPRNKGGSVSRKILNEDELVREVKKVVSPGDRVQGKQLDALPMKEQLEVIARTDILIGMHGAGLSHTLFLPSHGGLIELYPVYWSQVNRHFRAMATWRGLHYRAWQNSDSMNEKDNHLTYIPPKRVVGMLKEILRDMCGR